MKGSACCVVLVGVFVMLDECVVYVQLRSAVWCGAV